MSSITPNEHMNESLNIQEEVMVEATLDEVWRAWTTNEGIQTFFSRQSNVQLGFRKPFEILFDGKIGSNGCEFLSYVPNEMISFSWNAPPHLEHARGYQTFVVIQFEAVDSRTTRVSLIHLGFDEMKAAHPDHTAEWDQVREYFSGAWPYVLNNLKRSFIDGPRWKADGSVRWKDEQ